MTLAKFIDTRLKHGDYITISHMNGLTLYRGLVADIPYRLAVKSTVQTATISPSVGTISVYVIYHNN